MKDQLTELHTKYPEIAIQWLDIPRHLTTEQRDTIYRLIKNINPDCLVMFNFGQESREISGDYTIEKAAKVTWPTDILNSEITPIKQAFHNQQSYKGKNYELGYEHCISLSKGWFWKEPLELKSLETLVDVWNETGKLNGNLLLNVAPNKEGQIPEASIHRLMELHNFIEKSNEK